MAEDPESWNSRDDYKAAEASIKTLAVTNDHAEWGVALIQDAAHSDRFKCEDQLQYALQVIEHSQAVFPDARKSTLLKKPWTELPVTTMTETRYIERTWNLYHLQTLMCWTCL